METRRRQLFVTLLLPVVAWAAQGVILPGIECWKIDLVFKQATFTPDLSSMSVVAIGLNPALTGFLLVELCALLVPRWRPLRVGGPEARRSLRRAAIAITILVAAVHGWWVAAFLHQPMPYLPGGGLIDDPGLGSRLLMTATLVGGTCFLLALAWLIDRYGLGCGFSVLLAAAALPALVSGGSAIVRARQRGDVTAGDGLTLVLEAAVIVAATRKILTVHRKIQPRLRHPTSGLVPLVAATALLLLPRQLAALGVNLGEAANLEPETVSYKLALISALCIVLSLLFYRARRGPFTVG